MKSQNKSIMKQRTGIQLLITGLASTGREKIKHRACIPLMSMVAACLMFTAALVLVGFQLKAQAPAAAASRFLGTVTAVNGTTLTVKTDSGETHSVDVPETAILKQVEPGAKDLNEAQTIPFSSIATGDRVLVRLDPKATAGTTVALQVIAVKQADLAKKQEAERQSWVQHGVGGLVKSVDAAAGTIVITSGVGAMAKTYTIHTGKNTVLKRYAPGTAPPHPMSVETFGGGTWITNLAMMSGLSADDFGWRSPYLTIALENRVRGALPEVLSRCGYRTVAMLPMGYTFVNEGPFLSSIGFETVLDIDDIKAPSYHMRDDFYYRAAEAFIARHREEDGRPLFLEIETMFLSRKE